MNLFVIKDVKAGLFLSPFFQRSVADAVRGFEVAANEGDTNLVRFPHDYRLLHLGQFDSDKGKLSVFDDVIDLGSCADFKRAPEAQLPMFPSKSG